MYHNFTPRLARSNAQESFHHRHRPTAERHSTVVLPPFDLERTAPRPSLLAPEDWIRGGQDRVSFTQALIRSRTCLEVIGRKHAMGGAGLRGHDASVSIRRVKEDCETCAYDRIFWTCLGSVEDARVDVGTARCGCDLRKDKVLLGRGLQGMFIRNVVVA